jgi:hypothetical protein
MVLQVLPFVCGEANVDCCVCYVGLDCVQAHVLSFCGIRKLCYTTGDVATYGKTF